ncbi:MAG: bifunctional oligoribonuclease/PAP phosphatase NrnA [Frankiales bacterium]|nr:bifunctional oligoribonuclease/PAP phosphatase NrnA [Frankiales bacterium]
MTDLDWKAAVALLEGAGEVVLLCHVAPDGDALGSLLALGSALRRRGQRVVCSWGEEPLVVPEAYAYLEGQDLLVPPSRVPAAPELLVTLDSSSPDRLGLLVDRLDTAGQVLVVDHHTAGEPFGDVRLVDPAAAATVVLVTELLDRLGCPLDAPVAAALYTGLVTDTGSFKHASTTPEVHALAGRLLGTGIRHDLISRSVWDTNPFGYLQALGAACAGAVLEPDAVGGLGLVWSSLTDAQLVRAGVALADVEGVIDVLRTTREAEVAVVLKQEPGGDLRVSTRSKGAVDLGAVCGALGGGGHRFAAGFTSTDDVPGTLAVLRRALADAPHLVA